MRLPRGLLTGLAFIALLLLGGWLLSTWSAPPSTTSAATAMPQPAVEVAMAPLTLGTHRLPPEARWVVWHDNNGQIHRRPAGADYAELYAALQRSLDEDRIRLQVLGRDYLRPSTTPVLRRVEARLGDFMDQVGATGARLSRLDRALATVVAQTPPELTPAQRHTHAQQALTEHLGDAFTTQVLDGSGSVLQLQGAAQRALGLVRQDILQLCERYDRAFLWFLLHTPGSVQVQGAEGKWQPARAWQPATASQASLCRGLRAAVAGAGPAVDRALSDSFTATRAAVREALYAYADATAETVARLADRQQRYRGALRQTGLPDGAARPLSTLAVYLRSPVSLLRASVGPVGTDPAYRGLGGDLEAALALLSESVQLRLHTVLDDYIASELSQLSLALDARSRGPWSLAP